MNFHKLRCDHRVLLSRAADLAGLALGLKTAADASRAVAAIADLDGLIVAHLEAEDAEVYGVLMASPDPDLSGRATAAYDDVGGLVGAWSQFADYWTQAEILARPEAFGRAADCVLNALILRVRFEEETLYPAAESVARTPGARQAA